MTQYIVLYPISLDSGPIIQPAQAGEPPVLVDEATLFETPSEFFTNEERLAILINRRILAPASERVVAAHEKATARALPPETPITTDKE